MILSRKRRILSRIRRRTIRRVGERIGSHGGRENVAFDVRYTLHTRILVKSPSELSWPVAIIIFAIGI